MNRSVAVAASLICLLAGCRPAEISTGVPGDRPPERCPAPEAHDDSGGPLTTEEFMATHADAYNRALEFFTTRYPDEFVGVVTRTAPTLTITFRFTDDLKQHRNELDDLAPGLGFLVASAPRSVAEMRAAIDEMNEAKVLSWPLEHSNGMPYIGFELPPGSERQADELYDTYGDLLRIRMGAGTYIPTGCAEPRPTIACWGTAPMPAVEPGTTVTARLEIEPTLRQDQLGGGVVVVTNHGSEPIASYGSGSGGSATIIDASTRHIVGQYVGAFTADLAEWRVEPGETIRFPISFSAAACGGDHLSIPPGEYLAVAGFAYGPVVADRTTATATDYTARLGVAAEAPLTIVAAAP